MPVNIEHIKFAKGISVVIFADIVMFLLGFVRFPVTTKFLGGSLYGTWSIVSTTVSLATPIALLGLANASVRFLSAYTDKDKIREDYFSIFIAVLSAGTALTIIMFFCSGILSSTAFSDKTSIQYLQLGSLLILTESLVSITLAYFRTFRQMGKYSILTLLKATIEITLTAGFLLLGWGLTGVIIAALIDNIFFILATIIIIVHQIGFKIPKLINLRKYVLYGLPLVPNVALFWIISASSRYIIGFYWDEEQVGIFSAAYTLSNLVTFFVTPLTTVLFPTISKLYSEGNISETKTYLKYSLKYVMLITFPSAFGLSVLAIPLLELFSTEEFVSGAVVIPLISAGLVFFCFRQITTFGLYLVNKTHVVGILLIVAAVINIALNFLLIPHMGIIGSGIATLGTYIILGSLSLGISFHYIKFDIGIPFMGKSILASLIMAVAIWLFNPEKLITIVISVIFGAILYFALILIMRGFSQSEFNLVKRIVTSYSSTKKVK